LAEQALSVSYVVPRDKCKFTPHSWLNSFDFFFLLP
jgi:hypothetical protein